MNKPKCTRCGSENVQYIDNFITDTTILECKNCGKLEED